MKVKNLRWIVLSLIALVTIINYLDRGTLNYMWMVNQRNSYTIVDQPVEGSYSACIDPATSVYTLYDKDALEVAKLSSAEVSKSDDGAIEYISRGGIAYDLGLIDPAASPDEQQSQGKEILALITMCFMVAYGISQLVSGKIYDKIGTRKGFALSAIIWGAADAFTSMASGIKTLIGFRMGLGLGEAGPWPGTTKSNAEWFPTNERALAQGVFGAAASMGGILAPIAIPILFIAFGWRVTFIIVGSLGVLWVIPWLIINKKAPKDHPWITDEERKYIIEGQPECEVTCVKGKSWGELLRDRRNYSVILGRFFIDPIWWMFVTWLPIYLMEVFGLDIKEIAASAWVPYVGAAVGSLSGGWFSGKLIQMGKSVNFARKCAISIGAIITLPAMALAAMASSATSAVVLMAFILGGFQFMIANIQTIACDLHSGKTVGSLAGLGGASAVLGVLITMYLVPSITAGGNWILFFAMGGSLIPLSLLSVFLCARKIESIED